MRRAPGVTPTVPEMEIAVLGACLVSAAATELAVAQLQPADFFDDGRRLVFSAIHALVQKGTPVDRATVYQALEERPGGTEIPGALLLDLENGCPSPANARA